MKKYILLGIVAVGLLALQANAVRHAPVKAHAPVRFGSVNNPPNGSTIGATTQQTSAFYVDGNRTDSYTQNGNILTPYKTFSGAINAAAADAFNVSPFDLIPTNGAYVDGPPDTLPSSTYINGNQSTWVPASGATFPGLVEVYDTIVAGNLTFSSTSTTQLHQINNSVIASGNITANGLINFIGDVIASTTSTLTIASTGFMNFIGGQMNSTVVASAQANYNDALWNGSTTDYGIKQIGCANGGCMNVFGMTYINLSGNGINVASSGALVASGTQNNMTSFSVTVGNNATSTVTAGGAATLLCDAAQLTTASGTFIAPTGSNWQPCIDEKRAVLSGLTVGTSTVNTNLEWNALPSSTIRIGVTSTWPGCVEMYDRNSLSSTLNYLFVSSTALIVTSTNPGFCQ